MRGRRKVLAAVLYVAGAASVLFVAYKGHDVASDAVLSYWPLYAVGMALVVAAALLWPKKPQDGEEREGEEGNGPGREPSKGEAR